MKNSKFIKSLIALLVTLALTGAMVCFAGCSDDKKSSRKDRDNKKSEKVDDEDDEDEDDEDDEDEDEDKDDKKSKKDKDDEDDEDEVEEEETTTTEEEVEETEEDEDDDSEGQKKKIGEDDDDIDAGDDMDNPFADALVTADSFKDANVKKFAQQYIDKEYFIMNIDADMVTDLDSEDAEISKHFVEGFIAMGGSLSASISAGTDEESEADLSGTDYSMVMLVLFDDYKSAEDYFNTMAEAELPADQKDKIKVEETADGKVINVEEDGSKVTVTLTNDGIVIMDTSMVMG